MKPAGKESADKDEETSRRKRIAAIAGRLTGLTPTPAAKRDASTGTGTGTGTSAAAAQTASVLSAMAYSSRREEEGYAYESPLHARRRLAAIASQLGLAASTARQAPSLDRPRPQPQPGSAEVGTNVKLPRYHELPAVGGYAGCAWNVWGPRDQLGTLNLLTDAVVARAAADEIRTGVRINLNWPLHLPHTPFFSRSPVLHHPWGKRGPAYTQHRHHVHRTPTPANADADADDCVPVSDETLHLNTQSGSQWDGLRHYGHMGLNIFYGGVPRAEIQDTFQDTSTQGQTPAELAAPASRHRNQLGVHNLVQHGLSGRAVLLDVFGHLSASSDSHSPHPWRQYAYDPATAFPITRQHLLDTAKAQHVSFRPGDILLIRSGFTLRYYHSTPDERTAWAARNSFAGLDQSEDTKQFLWDNHFAAVAGDAPGFEVFPALPGLPRLHETLLAMWGMPIGEMFDLEHLARHCSAEKRWTFFFSSQPLNLIGGVASTANAGAIF